MPHKHFFNSKIRLNMSKVLVLKFGSNGLVGKAVPSSKVYYGLPNKF